MNNNIETIKQIYVALDQGDIDSITEKMAHNVKWEHHPTGNLAQQFDVPYMRPRNGKMEIAEFYNDIEEDFELHSYNPYSFLKGDCIVAVIIKYDLTVKSTGKRIEDEEIHVWEFGQDGKITGFRHFLDTAKAIEAHSQ